VSGLTRASAPIASSRSLVAAAGAAVVVLALAGCSADGSSGDTATDAGATDQVALASGDGLESGLGNRAENRSVTFIQHVDPGDPFHAAIRQGAQDAAELFNIELNAQTSSGDQDRYNELIGTAVTNRPAAIAVTLDDANRYTENVCAAQEAGIPVITFNITQPDSDVVDCTVAFVGQDFEEAGYILGQRLLAEHPEIGDGDVVFTPVEFPEEFYARERRAGVQRALDEVGATTDVLESTIEDSQALERMSQYLLGNPDVAAIVPLGGTPHRNAVAAAEAAGVDAPIAGFDLSQQVVEGIQSGRITAAADQQPYVQGFQAITELALLLDFGLSPADINSGGSGLVDESNVEIVAELAGRIR
jgi:simple sugar transport system substrate-binding protein